MNIQTIVNDTLQNTDVRQRAMLVTLSLKCWTARKKDKKAPRSVAAEYHANERAISTHKMLIDTAKYIAPILSVQNQMRAHHYATTSPWMDNGSRILAIKNLQKYCSGMNDYQEQIEPLIDRLMTIYPQAKSEARALLGDMYDDNDYPDISVIRAKFDCDYFMIPLPDVEDFRVQLPEGDIQRAADKIHNALANAARDGWLRLLQCIEDVATKLPAYENKEIRQFNNSLIENLRKLLDVLPGLNLLDDPDLSRLADEAKRRIACHDAQTLRESDVVRCQTAHAATEILEKMRFSMLAKVD